ncbi:MAG: hypothetical protein ACYC0V_13540 [Armatimonadota bacterium]
MSTSLDFNKSEAQAPVKFDLGITSHSSMTADTLLNCCHDAYTANISQIFQTAGMFAF